MAFLGNWETGRFRDRPSGIESFLDGECLRGMVQAWSNWVLSVPGDCPGTQNQALYCVLPVLPECYTFSAKEWCEPSTRKGLYAVEGPSA